MTKSPENLSMHCGKVANKQNINMHVINMRCRIKNRLYQNRLQGKKCNNFFFYFAEPRKNTLRREKKKQNKKCLK